MELALSVQTALGSTEVKVGETARRWGVGLSTAGYFDLGFAVPSRAHSAALDPT